MKKTCTKCKIEKETTEFYKSRTGFEAVCKGCRKENSHKVYLNNKDAIIERTSKYNKEHPEIVKNSQEKRREQKIEYHKNWYQENKEKKNQQTKQYYQENKEKHNEWMQQYYKDNREETLKRISEYKKANPEKMRIWDHNRRANKNGTYTEVEWLALCEKFGNKCLACKKQDVKLTVDHVIPLSKGGLNTIENLQPLCGPCNSSKNTKIKDYRG